MRGDPVHRSSKTDGFIGPSPSRQSSSPISLARSRTHRRPAAPWWRAGFAASSTGEQDGQPEQDTDEPGNGDEDGTGEEGSGKVPDALGLTGGFAEYSDTEGCWIADDPNGWIYFFDILAAGSDAGDPDDAKPQTGGVKELDRVSEVKVTGSLAETGSNSALPVIGLVGGVAVVADAGALFVVRRGKGGAEA